MKGYITSITEGDSDFVLEVSIEKPTYDFSEFDKMSKEERKGYFHSDEHQKLLGALDKKRANLRKSLRLGEVELTL